MPNQNSMATGALIVATIATAAGLNLAVMNLGSSETATSGQAPEAGVPLPATDAVELTSAVISSPSASGPAGAVVGLAQTDAAADVGSSGTQPSGAVDPAPTTGALPPSAAASSSVPPATVAPTTSSTGSTKVVASEPTTAPSPQATVPPSSAPTTSPTTAPTTVPTPSTAPVSTEYLTYEFEGIASIIVALHDGRRLEFWSVDAEDGWVFLVEDRGPDEVKIKFRPAAGGEEAEFEIEFEDGRLQVKREY